MSHPVRFVIGAVICHWLLGSVLSPWWVPDLTLVAVVLVSSGGARRWWLAAGLAGAMTMCWVPQFPLAVLCWYGALAGGIRWMAGVWDVNDARIQLLIVGAGACSWMGLLLWCSGASVPPVFGLAAAHVAVTLLMLPLLRRLMLRFA